MTSKHSTTKSETHSEGCPQQMSQRELLSGAREGRKVRSHRGRQVKRKSLPKSPCRKQGKAPWIYCWSVGSSSFLGEKAASVPSGFILEAYSAEGLCDLSGTRDALESPGTFPAPPLEPAVSPRSSGSFHWRLKPKSGRQVCSLLLGCHSFQHLSVVPCIY